MAELKISNFENKKSPVPNENQNKGFDVIMRGWI
jgi:hypothetical protein